MSPVWFSDILASLRFLFPECSHGLWLDLNCKSLAVFWFLELSSCVYGKVSVEMEFGLPNYIEDQFLLCFAQVWWMPNRWFIDWLISTVIYNGLPWLTLPHSTWSLMTQHPIYIERFGLCNHFLISKWQKMCFLMLEEFRTERWRASSDN